MVVGSEWLLLSAAQREVKLEASSFTTLRGSGLVSLQRNKKQASLFMKPPLSVKKKKKSVSYLQASPHRVLHPNLTAKSLIFKSHIVSSAFHKKKNVSRSRNLGIDSSGVFFKRTHNPLFFFQHDSKPSTPIRISGLMCFHTLLPFHCSLSQAWFCHKKSTIRARLLLSADCGA